MRPLVAILSIFAISTLASAQKRPTDLGTEFEMGVHTFFDFGPPTDFYQLYVVRGSSGASRLERITLTPEGIKCLAPPKIEVANAKLDEPIAELLGKKNPCDIPEKELKREKKRCKKCLVFSGANVTMRVQCGRSVRLIRSDILDRDMFDSAAHTPENTTWTMALLTKLDNAAGPGVMEKPMFELTDPPATKPTIESEAMRTLSAGGYDALFSTATIKVSDLYQQARSAAPPRPTVTLAEAPPIAPATLVEPQYPPIARVTRTEGKVTFAFEIDGEGKPVEVSIVAGHPLLQASVKDAVAKWRFSATAEGTKIQGTYNFALICPVTESR